MCECKNNRIIATFRNGYTRMCFDCGEKWYEAKEIKEPIKKTLIGKILRR